MKRKVQNTKFQTLRAQKGITLIALVITIIVLLILAGVAINMAIDSNGLFGKANEAAESWNTAVENEQTAMQGLLDKLEIDPPGVVSAQGVSLDQTSINVVIGKTAQLTATIEPSEATNKNIIWSSSDEAKVTVDENGLVTGISEGTATITVTTESKNKTATCSVTVTLPEWVSDTTKISAIVKETSTIAGENKTRIVPIPVGYTASQISTPIPENTIAGGLVIYQIPEGATVNWEASTITIGEATTNLQKTVNQFVWIPVDDINQMVMCKSNNILADSEGNKICNLKLVNGVLQCTNTAHTANAKKICGRLYSTTSTPTTVNQKSVYTTSMNFEDRTQTWTDDTGYREPDIVSSSDTDDKTGNLATFTTQMTDDFVNMSTSVAKYGGFYVSRYEAGANGASKKNQKVMTGASSTGNNYIGVTKWYGLYNKAKSATAVDKTAVSTHMIYGSQYDQIINFIGSEAQTGHPGNVVTSQSKTGTAEDDRLNNIYDLEGNHYEWTAQAKGTSSRVRRGSYYGDPTNGSGIFFPCSEAYGTQPGGSSSAVSTRLSLYL